MKKALLWLTLLLIVCTATTAWAETMYAPYQMQVYAQPNYNAKLLGTVASGTACRVGLGSTNDGWNKYSFSLEGKSITGWVYGSATYNSNPPPKDAPVYDMDKLFFQIVSDGSSKSTSSSGGILSPVEMGHWVEASGASGTPIYASYSASSKVLTTVEKNTVLYVSRKLADESMYYATANGKTGYVLASQVDFTVSGTLSDTEPIIRYAGENGLRLYRMCGVFSQLHLGNYKTGVCVKVLGQHSRSWAYVQVGAAKGYALYSELTDAPPEAAASETLYVTCDTFDNVTLSTEPGDSGRHMGVLMVGTPVCVLAQQGNYYRVQVGDEIGYLPKSNLQRKSDSQDADKQVVGIRYVCSESGTGAYLFKEPSLTSHIIELVPERAKVSFLRSYSNGFAYVIYNGQAGYMKYSLLDLKSQNPNQEGPQSEVLTQEEVRAAAEALNRYQVPEGKSSALIYTGNEGKLNLRSAPDGDSSILGKYVNGTTLAILENLGGWCKVATGDGKTGYMMTKYLKMEHAVQATDDLSDGDQEDVEIPSYTIRYIDPGDGSEVPGYAAPSTEANVLFFYPAGYRVVVHSIENGWAFISMDTVGRYVQTKYLSLTNPTDTEHSSNDLEGSGLARTMVIQTGNSGKLNLRASPGGKLVERYPNGTQVTVLSQANKNGWAQVKIQGKSGYVQVKYLADSNAAADEPASSTKVSASPSAIEQRFVHTGNSGKLNLRRTAGGKLIDRYPNGTPVTVHSVSGAWAYVTIGGKQGFVMEKYLSANAAAADQSVSQEAPAAESSAPIDEPSLQTPSAGDGWRIQTGNSGKLNLRTEPNRNAPTLDRYPNGTAVRIIRPRGAWAYVQIGRQYGYVMTKYLAP